MLNLGVNYVGVVVAAIVAMVIGYIWYMPALFGNSWAKETGMKLSDMKKGMGKAATAGFIAAFITAFALDVVLKSTQVASLMDAVWVGLLVWFGFFATMEMMRMAFEKTSMKYFWIQSAHHLVVLVAISAVLFMWG